MASIHTRELADGTTVYRVTYRLGGRQKVITYGSATTAQRALDILDRHGTEAGTAILEARARSAHTPTIADQLETHLARVAAHATPGTVTGYRRDAARTWLPRLGDLPVDALTKDHVTKWVAWQREQPTRRGGTYATKSIANAARLLSSVMASALDDGHVTANVAKGARMPGDKSTSGRVYLLPDEFTAIYGHLPPRWQPFVATLYGTGLRWGEATALEVRDIELDGQHGLVHVRHAWKKGDSVVYLGTPKSRRALRSVTITGTLVDLLRTHLAGRPASALAFTALRGGRIMSQNWHTRVWRPAVVASGIDKRPDPHSLRHSHASNLIRAGIPLPVIQRRLGHENITTTIDTYGHLAPDAYAGAAEATALAMAGALPQIEG